MGEEYLIIAGVGNVLLYGLYLGGTLLLHKKVTKLKKDLDEKNKLMKKEKS